MLEMFHLMMKYLMHKSFETRKKSMFFVGTHLVKRWQVTSSSLQQLCFLRNTNIKAQIHYLF